MGGWWLQVFGLCGSVLTSEASLDKVVTRRAMQMSDILSWSFLGRTGYQEALALQMTLKGLIQRGEHPDMLLLCEHPEVITLGRGADPTHVLALPDQLAERRICCVRVGRGGDVTYHGPGQLVGYPVRRVGRAIRAHVEGMTRALQDFLADLGISAQWDAHAPGLWTEGGKIAAVGVDARGGVATHGFALNLDPRLTDYALIVPCGDPRPVTSVAAIRGQSPSMLEAARTVARACARHYGAQPVERPASWTRRTLGGTP